MRAKIASIAVCAILTGVTFQAWGEDASTAPKAPRFAPLSMNQLNVYQKPPVSYTHLTLPTNREV